MISLTDYLGYLNSQIMDARRLADEAAVAMAKTYAADEYLKYFKVPRFTLPTVKLNVPIKIDAINQETQYDFEFTEGDFLGRFNRGVTKLSLKYQQKLAPLNAETVKEPNFQRYLDELDGRDGGFVRDVDFVLQREETDKFFDKIFLRPVLGRPFDNDVEKVTEELRQLFHDSLKAQFRPLVTNIKNLAVTPQANGLNANDSESLLLHLDLEMQEEGFQIRQVTDEDGNVVEQLIID